MISAIIPVYRAEPFIGDAVASVLDQTLPPDEIVLASDDGQDYIEILENRGIRDKRIRCVSTGGIATGVAHARNTALAAAEGNIIASLDADDRLCPDALARLVPLAQKEGAAYGEMAIVDFASGDHLFNCNRKMYEGRLGLADIITSNLHSYAGLVFDKSQLPDVRWNEGIHFWEDMLFYASCCDQLGYMYHVPEQFYIYSRREGSVCNMPDTGHVAQYWAQAILDKLVEDSLPFSIPARETLKAYFYNRICIEKDFIAATEAGECKDYQEFMHGRLDLFYNLPPYSPR
jgi:glycosyltransferase involved in cell wall biosynthesis